MSNVPIFIHRDPTVRPSPCRQSSRPPAHRPLHKFFFSVKNDQTTLLTKAPQYNEPRTPMMMKPIAHIPVIPAIPAIPGAMIRVRAASLKPHFLHPLRAAPVPISMHRVTSYARHKTTSSSAATGASSSSSSSKRRSVTPFNDTGQVPWSSLSIPEKAGRAAQQSFNMGVILVGVVLTSGVAYLLYTDVFSPDSKTAHFNRAVKRIRSAPQCTAILGPGNELLAHGNETFNKWRRSRPIQSTLKTDKYGHQHLIMHFYVEGPKDKGLVMMHLVKTPNTGGEFVYKYLYLDVPGHDRIYLENSDAAGTKLEHDKKFKLFGVSWTQ